MTSGSTTLSRVKVIDDDPGVREANSGLILAAECEPVVEDGPLGQLRDYLERPALADAAVIDFQLSPRGYAEFDGASLAAAWYKRSFPAILCTTFEKSNTSRFHAWRRWLPVVMPPSELTPETLLHGLRYASAEMQNEFSAERRPWPALVRFTDYDPESRTAYAKLPGWGPEAVAIRIADLPIHLQSRVITEPNLRCRATANLGALANHELYITDWQE